MNEKLFLIEVRGRNDSTYAVLKLTPSRRQFLDFKIAEINSNANSGSQPTLHLYRIGVDYDIEECTERLYDLKWKEKYYKIINLRNKYENNN